jgi:hypothetical protein
VPVGAVVPVVGGLARHSCEHWSTIAVRVSIRSSSPDRQDAVLILAVWATRPFGDSTVHEYQTTPRVDEQVIYVLYSSPLRPWLQRLRSRCEVYPALLRLVDMGIERFMVSSSLVGDVGQRLVRRICPSCAEAYDPSPQELRVYEVHGGTPKDLFVRGVGCNYCSASGLRGRVGVYEVLEVTDQIRCCVNVSMSSPTNATASGLRSSGLQDHIRDLERVGSGQPPDPSTSDQQRSLSRAERRRLERERARRRRT